MTESTGPTDGTTERPSAEGPLRISSERLPWSPTPNNPSTLLDADSSAYFLGSLRRLGSIFDALKEQHGDKDAEIIDFMERVALGTQLQRYAHSSDQWREKKINTDDELAQRLFYESCVGNATPYQLLELMHMCPELVNCELAKQTHPFDWEAAMDVDCIVGLAILQFDPDAIVRDHASKSEARAKLIGNLLVDGELRAIVLRRKRVYAEVQRDGRRQTVMKVTDLLMDGREGTNIDLAPLSASMLNLEKTSDKDTAAYAHAKDAFAAELDLLRLQANDMLAINPRSRPADIQPIGTYYYAVAESIEV